ncbi:MAG TPA: DUF418 domain-containing protein [Allosphingosinicella sp.]|nr:DUF418 domain-containing protein [Allosphingosinicella sp.]
MTGERIAALDIVRGVAVMGILAMNVLAFAMPGAAYVNPMAYGTEGPADIASWLVSFIFIDGKMRGLFSFLFGASTLLVVERAVAAGQSGAAVHYSRMVWLLVFGLLHFYFVWWGDILSLYAPVGMVAYAFWRLRPRTLIWIAIGLLVLQTLLFAGFARHLFDLAHAAAAPGARPAAVREWADMQEGLGLYTPGQLQHVLALYRGSYAGIVAHSLSENLWDPLESLWLFGMETLAYMLLGMAALKSGFLTGAWSDAGYRKAALIGFGIAVPVYAMLGWLVIRGGFATPMLIAASIAATVPVRPLMIVATAALIILLTRGGGPLVARIAAAGRAAFTNYLGTSLLMTALFYGWGFGLFGELRRIELWIPVVAMWALILLWSRPWLDRFRYGPFEWLWRSLARWQLQPMEK